MWGVGGGGERGRERDLYVFIFGGREFQTYDPENASSSYIGQCECA